MYWSHRTVQHVLKRLPLLLWSQSLSVSSSLNINKALRESGAYRYSYCRGARDKADLFTIFYLSIRGSANSRKYLLFVVSVLPRNIMEKTTSILVRLIE